MNVFAFTAAWGTVLEVWTGASMHFGREAGVYVLNTWVKKWSARRNGFGQAVNVILRASRAVSPMLEQVSGEEEVEESEESTCRRRGGPLRVTRD